MVGLWVHPHRHAPLPQETEPALVAHYATMGFSATTLFWYALLNQNIFPPPISLTLYTPSPFKVVTSKPFHTQGITIQHHWIRAAFVHWCRTIGLIDASVVAAFRHPRTATIILGTPIPAYCIYKPPPRGYHQGFDVPVSYNYRST